MRPPRFSILYGGWPQGKCTAQAHDLGLRACFPPCPHISASWGMSSPNKGRHLHPANSAHQGLTTQVCGLMPHLKSPPNPLWSHDKIHILDGVIKQRPWINSMISSSKALGETRWYHQANPIGETRWYHQAKPLEKLDDFIKQIPWRHSMISSSKALGDTRWYHQAKPLDVWALAPQQKRAIFFTIGNLLPSFLQLQDVGNGVVICMISLFYTGLCQQPLIHVTTWQKHSSQEHEPKNGRCP